jgi:hypothetical protein
MNSTSPVARPAAAAGPPGGGADPVTSLFRAHGLALTRLALLLVGDLRQLGRYLKEEW